MSCIRTKSLFREFIKATGEGLEADDAPYTLSKNDLGKSKSLYKLYMEMEDLTEYEFAKKYLEGGWRQWQALQKNSSINCHIVEWRKELELKVRAGALLRIIAESKDPGSKFKFSANRFIVDRGWKSKEETKADPGRPKKVDVVEEAEKMAEYDENLQLGLKVIGLSRPN